MARRKSSIGPHVGVNTVVGEKLTKTVGSPIHVYRLQFCGRVPFYVALFEGRKGDCGETWVFEPEKGGGEGEGSEEIEGGKS